MPKHGGGREQDGQTRSAVLGWKTCQESNLITSCSIDHYLFLMITWPRRLPILLCNWLPYTLWREKLVGTVKPLEMGPKILPSQPSPAQPRNNGESRLFLFFSTTSILVWFIVAGLLFSATVALTPGIFELACKSSSPIKLIITILVRIDKQCRCSTVSFQLIKKCFKVKIRVIEIHTIFLCLILNKNKLKFRFWDSRYSYPSFCHSEPHIVYTI